jgi:hypothetical protein
MGAAPFVATESGRALALVYLRWQELISPAFDISRRSRTLSSCAAVHETVELADAWVRAQGRTQPNEEPRKAGHGIETLPQVAEEALELLRADRVLRDISEDVTTRIDEWLEFLVKNHRALSQPLVERCRALLALVRAKYAEAALSRLTLLVYSEPKKQSDVLDVCEHLVPELRAIGWSDRALRTAIRTCETAASPKEALDAMHAALSAPAERYVCLVPVTLGDLRLGADYKRGVVELLMSAPEGIQIAPPIARCVVTAFDAVGAARVAHAMATSIVAAVDMFSTKEAAPSGTTVIVSKGAADPSAIDVRPPAVRYRGGYGQKRIEEALDNAISVARTSTDDAVFEAIRHSQRASAIADDEVRFLVLWLGIERLLQGMDGYDSMLSGARQTLPKCIAIAKLRRDVGGMSATLGHAVAQFGEQSLRAIEAIPGLVQDGKVSREKLLSLITGDDAAFRELTSCVYDDDPCLVMWMDELRRALGAQGKAAFGKKVADYLERSRLRTDRQVMRLYRARNRVAHAGKGPQWIADLVRHADFYLSQLIGIVTHGDRSERPVDTLARRVGCYDAFIEYLKSRDTVEPGYLLSPMSLFRDAGGGVGDPGA